MFILAVIALMLVLVNSIILIGGALTFKQNTSYGIDSTQALNLAEAGIDKAVASMNTSGGSYIGEEETTLGSGSYSVTIIPKNSSTNIIESTGYIPNKAKVKSKRTIRIEISKGVGVAFNYGAQVGQGGLQMFNNAVINGSVYSNGNISMSNNAWIKGGAYVAGGTQATADQQHDCSAPNCGDFIFGTSSGGNSQLDVAQSFKPSTTAVINKVSLKLKKIGSPPNITVRILGDSNGKPNKNNVLTQGTLNASLVTSQYGFVDVSLNSTPTLSAESSYWIMLDTSSNSTNYWHWSMDTLQGYSRGFAVWSPNWQASNPAWNNILGDLGFKIFMGGVATSIQGGSNSVIGENSIGDAHANILANLTIRGNAYYQSASNIIVDGTQFPGSPDPAPISMPISDGNIEEWKTQASSAGIFTGDITSCPSNLPAGKYIGSVNLSGCTFTVGSPIWLTGNLTFENGVTMKLDPSFGSSSGSFIVDNFVNFGNNNKIQGSGSAGSYLILISEFNTRDDSLSRDAIVLSNNGNSGVIYSNLGSINISNNNNMTEITGWKIIMQNNVNINYEQGLASTFFSSGPSGAFSVIKGTYQVK